MLQQLNVQLQLEYRQYARKLSTCTYASHIIIMHTYYYGNKWHSELTSRGSFLEADSPVSCEDVAIFSSDFTQQLQLGSRYYPASKFHLRDFTEQVAASICKTSWNPNKRSPNMRRPRITTACSWGAWPNRMLQYTLDVCAHAQTSHYCFDP